MVLLQPKGPDTVHALHPELISLNYSLPDYGVDFEFQPLDFVQVNGSLNQLMIKQAIGLLDLSSEERVLDLFCGLGNFTLPIAGFCHSVMGVEGDEGLIKRAQENALRNDIRTRASSTQTFILKRPGWFRFRACLTKSCSILRAQVLNRYCP